MPENPDSRYRIHDLAAEDRPRERLAALGARALNNAELLAILLRVGVEGRSAVAVAQDLLSSLGQLPGLYRAGYSDLCAVHGVGPAKAAQLQAALELGRRVAVANPDERPAINSPADAAALVQYEMGSLPQENVWVLLLDTRNRYLKTERVYQGSVNTSQIRLGEIFREAVKINAAGVIVVHNHPSGDPSPSPDDVAVTRALVEAGKLLDIPVLDHLVIGHGRFVSLKERGLGFG
jgi:DNA repair protein RadC